MKKNILNEVSFGIKQRVEENYRIYGVKEFINEFIHESTFKSETEKREKTTDLFKHLMESYRMLWEDRGDHNNSSIILSEDYCLPFLVKYGINLEGLGDIKKWYVDNYKIMNEIKEAGIDKMEIVGPSKIHDPMQRRYIPSDFPNFYAELAKVLPFDKEGLINFISTFGLVGGTPPLFYESEKDGKKSLLRYQISFLNLLYMDLIEYQRMFWIFIHYMIYEGKTKIPFYFSYWHNPKLSLKMNLNGEISPSVLVESMFDVAYFQMFKAISNHAKLRKCDFCKCYFEVTHEKEKFCPPLPFHKRSSCEMAYNNRMRKARKLYDEGRTLEEIDKQVDLPIEEIKDYLQRREEGKP